MKTSNLDLTPNSQLTGIDTNDCFHLINKLNSFSSSSFNFSSSSTHSNTSKTNSPVHSLFPDQSNHSQNHSNTNQIAKYNLQKESLNLLKNLKSNRNIDEVYEKAIENILFFCNDPHGNYLIQDMISNNYFSSKKKSNFISKISINIKFLIYNIYGIRIIQKIIETCQVEDEINDIITYIKDNINYIITDKLGIHLILKLIYNDKINNAFVFNYIIENIRKLSNNDNSICLIQKIISDDKVNFNENNNHHIYKPNTNKSYNIYESESDKYKNTIIFPNSSSSSNSNYVNFNILPYYTQLLKKKILENILFLLKNHKSIHIIITLLLNRRSDYNNFIWNSILQNFSLLYTSSPFLIFLEKCLDLSFNQGHDFGVYICYLLVHQKKSVIEELFYDETGIFILVKGFQMSKDLYYIFFYKFFRENIRNLSRIKKNMIIYNKLISICPEIFY